jgi:fumarate reductase subunit D
MTPDRRPPGTPTRSITPFLWFLFSVGGTVAALLFPIHLFLTGLVFPLGLLEAPRYDVARGLVGHPVARLYLFVLISLPLFHWAHRFRYTLYDGLQVKHLTPLIVVLCYGTALIASALAAYTLWKL